MPIAGLLVPDASLLNIIFSPAPNLTYESHAMSLFFYFRWPSEVNEISRQLRLLNDIVMYLEDEGHQISNRIIVKMNIEVEVEKIIKKGHRSDLTPEVWAIGFLGTPFLIYSEPWILDRILENFCSSRTHGPVNAWLEGVSKESF